MDYTEFQFCMKIGDFFLPFRFRSNGKLDYLLWHIAVMTRGKFRLRGLERWYFLLCTVIFFSLSLSVIYQYMSTSELNSVLNSDDDHTHSRHSLFDSVDKKVIISDDVHIAASDTSCTYWNCLDSYKCIEDGQGKISVYIYDVHRYVDSAYQELIPLPSKEYALMLWSIVNSRYIVTDPNQACILVPSIDLLNRENFSGQHAAKILSSLPHWNNGTNHLIFNMISGKSPDYLSTLDFARGKSIITGSGFTQRSYRQTFDVSIPLFNPHQNPEDFSNSHNRNRKHFLVAAQKVYFQNIYNQLSDLQAKRSDILILLTKCSESQRINVKGIARCDGLSGKAYPYPSVLTDAKFCLITRERQLATTYLHDILRSGCVPVVSLDAFIMPFSEILDWKRAAIFITESRLDETVEILQQILEDGNYYQQLQDQCRFYYENYFSSLSKITWTTLDILNDRVLSYRARSYEHWNRPLIQNLPRSPFFVPLIPSQKQGFTAIVLTYDRFELMKRVVVNIAQSRHVSKIIVVWNNPDLEPPADIQWPSVSVPIKVRFEVSFKVPAKLLFLYQNLICFNQLDNSTKDFHQCDLGGGQCK